MKTKRSAFNRHVVFWSGLVVLSSLFILVYLVLLGNTNQVYKDIIIEAPAMSGANKVIEMRLLYILIFGGGAACSLWHLYTSRRNEAAELQAVGHDVESQRFAVCALCVLCLGYFALSQQMDPLLIVAGFYAVILFCLDSTLLMTGLCAFVTISYSWLAIYRIYAFAGGSNGINSMLVAVLTALTAALPMARPDRKRALIRTGLIAQLFLPGLLLIFTQSKYLYQGETMIIEVPAAVKIFVAVLVCVFAAESVVKLKKNWRSPEDISFAICIGGCISIMVFNFFCGSGSVFTLDIHHGPERIIGYSQIFELGQVPYKEYIPVSGMYCVLYGAVFKLFGGGLLSNLNVATNVFFTLVIIITAVALCAHMERAYVLLISSYLCFPDYNQYAFILPIMLILSGPKLIEKKNRWLKVWFITSLLYGLYYPVYGTAVCAAFIPLGIWQVVTYASSGQLRKDVKTVRFWVLWLLCLLPAVLCFPILIGEVRHILAMAGQSVYADGIARFGQVVTGSFMHYLGKLQDVRSAALYIVSFLMPAMYVWVALAAALKIGGVSLKRGRLRIENMKEACIGLALVIMPPIAYMYSAVRLDVGTIYARSLGAVLAGSVLLIAYVYRYLKDNTARYAAYCFAFLLAATVPSLGVLDNDAKMLPSYTVPEQYTYVNKDPVEKMGEGFFPTALYDDIRSGWDFAKDLDKDKQYFGVFSRFGQYYLFDLKGAATVEPDTVKGYGASEEAVEYMRRTEGVIGTQFHTVRNYYFYNWFLTSGEYMWSDDVGAFVPAGEIMDREETKQANKDVGMGVDELQQEASALGSSWDTLKGLFSEPEVDAELQTDGTSASLVFSEQLNGDDADYLYLEFADMENNYRCVLDYNATDFGQDPSPFCDYLMRKRYNPDDFVMIEWADDDGETHVLKCPMGRGKLLIPLGAGVKWLLHDHDGLDFSVERNGQTVSLPEIVSAQMLKLREVG